ncbi:peptidase S41-like protein [Elizabethkingia sp. YR214]|uniref:S41 family peptidase n=1 Tax=Elizabethkingia sp. YR214 TaxID=2135667 RepID=UPI000D3241F6|nr:S41 family peptidase [Elizabethkingia sp. YR214]PUB35903.1 peptidase S41-like protein [Elizabethkingia sp. YR214]
MKNLNKLSLVSLIGLLSFTSCSRDTINIDNNTNGGGTTVAVKAENDFVWKGLNSWYYWQKNVPVLADNFKNSTEYASTLNAKTPDALFYSFLYQYKVVDRFSWIEQNGVIQRSASIRAAITKTTGLEFNAWLKEVNKPNLIGIVNYVVPGSSAEREGVRRGDAILEVNGSPLTVDNYSSLFADSFSVTVQKVKGLDSNSDPIGDGDKRKVNLSSSEINDNPVAFDTVIDSGGKKIGYLVYNAFKSDFNGELNDAIGRMKQANITDLVLDLRYNGGGSVETAVALGTMITGKIGQPYVIEQYNDKHTKYSGAELMKKQVPLYSKTDSRVQINPGVDINTLGNLNKICILTTGGTASASELTIDALRPYMEGRVITIGETTYGKFVGSITLYDSPSTDYINRNASDLNKSHNWTMQPIVFAYWNSRNDAHPLITETNKNGGFVPNIRTAGREYFGNLKEFGNTSDPDLAKAIEQITGVSTKAQLSASIRNNSVSSFSDLTFFGSRKTHTPYATDAYIDNPKVKK